MGCPCEIKLYAESGPQARQGFGLAAREVQRLNLKYSHYRKDSYLAQMQVRAEQPGGVEVDRETAALFNYAETQFDISEGMFDITTRPLSALWDRIKSIPGEGQIAAALRKTGWRRLQWNGCTLKIPTGMEFDLGGIVKEYAADRAALLLLKAGFRSGYVDLGGDLHVLGPHPDGRPWKVGIRNPGRKNEPVAAVNLRSGGLASSGDYERYSEIDGIRYCHIINPRTGWPVNPGSSGLSAVSSLAPSCLLAGSVSTLAMLMLREKAISFLTQSGLRWLAISAVQNRNGVNSSFFFRQPAHAQAFQAKHRRWLLQISGEA
jgi:thiamine biosynthesis lipoprotein